MNTLEAIHQFINDIAGYKHNETPSAYRSKLARLKDHYNEDITSITPAHITDIRTRMLATHSPWTVKTTLTAFKHFFKWCTDQGIISESPAAALRIPTPPAPDPKAISPETVEQMIKAAESFGPPWMQSRNLAMIYWLRDTGGRVSGLVNVKLPDVNLTRGVATVIEKGKPRPLFINPPTIARIRAWLEHRPELKPVDDNLFIGNSGQALSRSGVEKIFSRIADHGGITARHNPHAFRHAFARDCLQNHADLSQVSQLLGHSSIAVTAAYYARWADHELKRIHKRVSPGASLGA